MIRLDGVGKTYPNGAVAVRELSLDFARDEIAVLVGPSGCGKTTTLQMINRLVEPSSGRIFLDGDDVTDVNPVELRRRIGYVIQQVGLFPHQTIGVNVATVPRLLGWKKDRVRARADELLDLVGLDPAVYRDRYPAQLSGGQRQRVGVARALAADPSVLLMDEPFGAIDPVTRTRLQDEFLRLHEEVRKTVVFVTHDIEEAVKMGDRIAILDVGGVLEQFDTPAHVLGHPASTMVADFVGADRALKRLRVTEIDPNLLEHPPTFRPDASLPEMRAVMARQRAGIGVVVDESGSLVGTVRAEPAEGQGVVVSGVQPVTATVEVGSTLQEAMAKVLLADSGWVAVVDGARFVGALTPESVFESLRASMRIEDG
ncbi:MAG TPA: betaine/proline/choline family ABC transporter ATP-binding protein [Acidimicrobiia bacterium]|jgi:osmoprotectant transport system ATP-binding protein